MHGEDAIGADGKAAPLVDWDSIAEWWRNEVSGDPVYREDIAPMLGRFMEHPAEPVLEIGCGEGQWLRWLGRDGGTVFGCDRSKALLTDAAATHPVVLCELPRLTWLRGQSVGTAF